MAAFICECSWELSGARYENGELLRPASDAGQVCLVCADLRADFDIFQHSVSSVGFSDSLMFLFVWCDQVTV